MIAPIHEQPLTTSREAGAMGERFHAHYQKGQSQHLHHFARVAGRSHIAAFRAGRGVIYLLGVRGGRIFHKIPHVDLEPVSAGSYCKTHYQTVA